MLEAINISKSFNETIVLKGITGQFPVGKVSSILGENGAGKSTFLNILSGVYTDYEGSLLINGQEVKFSDVAAAHEAGIAMIHQELNLVQELSIVENLFLGKELQNPWGFLKKAEMEAQVTKVMAKLGLTMPPTTLVNSLKIGEQQLVEIAKALLFKATYIFMDEPTSALSSSEIDRLFGIIEDLKADNKAIVYISHKMDEVFKLSDLYLVLRDGEAVGSGLMADVSENELIKMMVGRDILAKNKATKTSSQIALSVKNLNQVNFEICKGEVLGIFGLMGAGRTELLSSIFGLKSHSGQIIVDGKPQSISSPRDAIAVGMAYLTEDRKSEGLFLGLDCTKNINITANKDQGFVSDKNEKATAEGYQNLLGIKAKTLETAVKNLSGGNQQKVVIAKWLAVNPSIFLMDEPTRGIDINAKNEIYKLIANLADQGMSLLVASSEIPELLAIADRILVMANGNIKAEFLANEATEEKLLKAALG